MVTAVLAKAMVPVVVMGPPVSPVPVAKFVTVPLPTGSVVHTATLPALVVST